MTESILDHGCSCHINPPCAFCTSTFECEQCGTRVITDDQETEGWHDLLCDECFEPEPKADQGEDLMNTIRRASGGHQR